MNINITYQYKTYGETPHSHNLGESISNHHILPKYKMFYFAVLCLTICKIKNMILADADEKKRYLTADEKSLVQDIDYNAINKLISRNIVDILNESSLSCMNIEMRNHFTLNDPKLLTAGAIKNLVWTKGNLFIGPSGSYRSDDPGRENEQVKPQSFSDTQWNNIQLLDKLFTRPQGIPAINHLETSQVILPLHQLINIYKSFTNAFGGKEIHFTETSDWIATGTQSNPAGHLIIQNNYQYINLTKQINSLDNKLYKMKLRLKTSTDNPSCYYTVFGRKYNDSIYVKQLDESYNPTMGKSDICNIFQMLKTD